MRQHARYTLGCEWEDLKPGQVFHAVACAVRDFLIEAALETERRFREKRVKRVYYLSIEYLIGRSLSNNLRNLGLFDLCQRTLARMGVDLTEVLEQEPDAALGNGGLGRLAACLLDSMATLGYAGAGYGINYAHGLFRQTIVDRRQVEQPENWRVFGSPWLIMRPEEAVAVPLYGQVHHKTTPSGRYRPVWTDWRLVVGVPSDLPIVGYGGRTVTFLRLYSAHSPNNLDLQVFERGAYLNAVEQRIADETISQVLYPSDAAEAGRELRLRQEYFFAACALRDIVRKYEADHRDLERLPDHVAIQLNDTHPTLAIAEMMRFLVDDRDMEWERAWEITQNVFAYTNHTLLPEALETWSVSLLERVVPRHLHIIYEINRRLVEQVRAMWPQEPGKAERMAILRQDDQARISMGALAVVGSHATNGVSQLHSALLRDSLFRDYAEMWPKRFQSKTNGVTHRRWILTANPGLAGLLTEALGEGWIVDFNRVAGLRELADDEGFRRRFAAVKGENKGRLAAYVKQTLDVQLDSSSLYDVQVKRIHEYKRQLLNLLRIAHQYLRIVDDGFEPPVSRTCIFAGKAAVGYSAAKQIIRAILNVASVVNRDRKANKYLRVVFLPDYRVTLAELIMPAADLSEQISLAGMEASGTGNMKLAMNGALMIGTRDGANIEIEAAVGSENAFMFGLGVDEVLALKTSGRYVAREWAQNSRIARRVLEAFRDGRLSPKDPDVGQWVYHRLTDEGDPFMVLADLDAYSETQEAVDALYQDREQWVRKAVLNVAGMGGFSTDRTIREYARDIWHAEPAP